MKRAFMLIGLPASGKSTWISQQPGYNTRYQLRFVDEAPVLSSDDIIEKVASEWGYTYNEAFQHLIGFADTTYWRSLNAFSKESNHIYLDRTHLNKKSRSRALKMLRHQGYSVEAIVFPKPEDIEWMNRLNSRPGKNIPEGVLKNMANGYQAPTLDEGFASITTYS